MNISFINQNAINERITDIYNHPSVTTGSWVEDGPKSENGQYFCKCVYCDGTFIGHKRRVVCKTCAIKRIKHCWTL